MKLKPFKEVHQSNFPPSRGRKKPIFAYQSSQYLVQIFIESETLTRITVNSVKRRGNNWVDGITFDELQAIKSAVGYGESCAVEVYPEDSELINDANMRHLWVLSERPDFAWTRLKNAR
ncbi:DUF7694 domain-containing protein [Vibrio sp. E150_018]